jgi:hypothetical protein
VDVDIPPPPISADILRLLDTDYMGHQDVDEAIGPLGPKLTDTSSLNVSDGRSRSLFDAWKTRCLLLMWSGGCALADWSRRGLWCVFRRRCRIIGKLFVCLRGHWNVGVYPEKGMMLRLRRRCLVSAVMTTRAESRISHGLLVVRSLLIDPSAGVALVSIVSVYHMFVSLTDS